MFRHFIFKQSHVSPSSFFMCIYFISFCLEFFIFILFYFLFFYFKQSYVSPSILFLLLISLQALFCLLRASGSRHYLPFYDAEQKERQVVRRGDDPCADSLWPPLKSCTGDERNNSSEWTVIGHLLLEHARGILAWFTSARWNGNDLICGLHDIYASLHDADVTQTNLSIVFGSA